MMAVVNAPVLYSVEKEIMPQQKFGLRIVHIYIKVYWYQTPKILFVHHSAKTRNCVFQKKCEKSISDMFLKRTKSITPNVLVAKKIFKSNA